MGADRMTVCYVFLIYITDVIAMSLQLYFLVKILKKKLLIPFYFLFVVCGVIISNFLPTNTILGFMTLIFLLTVCGAFVCHADVKTSLLYAALMTEIMLLCYDIAESLTNLAAPFLPAAFHDMTGIAFILTSQAAALLLTVICYYVVYRYFADFSTAEMQQLFLVFIPILMIFIMSRYVDTMNFNFQLVHRADEETLEYLFSHWQLLAMHLLGLASLFCILFFFKKLQQNFRLSTELSLLEQEEHFLNQYVEEAKARYDRTKSFRHDIRNHIAVIKDLLRSGKLEEAVRYIDDLDDLAEKMSFPVSTNNPAVDILAGNKLGIAKSMGIDVDCSLLLPYPCGLKDIDICIVLSNALDNAIQACKSLDDGIEKQIHVSGRVQGDFLMIETRNSFSGEGVFKKGTGLSNVKKVAEKYNGAMSIEIREKVFILHVLLVIPQQPDDIPQQKD